ncbi:intersectin-EH-binding protein Ibp1 [Mycobacterium antarcticum]|uniref:intersectin-EH binding protein Ibp1 n=1 Tax=unclassified Mycolicibacterium TaxID=2636767 RepID=UPI0023890B33|nr:MULTISPECIES: intersectin-EH binding protein Ibp1 [unclassified Mycolicibacterium]BDX30198.1 intersectin-EH-binding protein Ibp1 [Mycolicibacterium sp. TUM20985]GLP79334.1 intersectin-EH-binding protein Ibp1 [Mycolicibacterium sp. TUM20984]
MATLLIPARRLLIAGSFAMAIAAAPAVAAFTVPSIAPSVAACSGGETEDVYTNACSPDMVPNSPIQATAGGLPSVDGIPCTGGNSGQCIGLSEDAPQYVPPSSTVGSSPTITGSTN